MSEQFLFPIYSNLKEKIKSTAVDLSNIQKLYILNQTKEMFSNKDIQDMENIYICIKLYYKEHSLELKLSKRTKGSITIELDLLPIPLKHIIYEFCLMYDKRIHESILSVNEIHL